MNNANDSTDRRQLTELAGMAVFCAATALILWQMGRVWWCKCGSPVPWSWEIWSMHNSQHALDPYTFTHLLHGLILCGILSLFRYQPVRRWSFLIAVGLEACWEILENSPIIIQRYREATISLDYFGDSIINSVFDILACAAGYRMAQYVKLKGSLILFAAIELLLVLTIRDCLILNIVMLVYPIEAIKQWQM